MKAEKSGSSAKRLKPGARNLLMALLLLTVLTSCENKDSGDGPYREVIFSKDLSEADIYYLELEFAKEEAKELYEEAIEYVKDKDLERAREKLLAANAIEPENPSVLISLGNIARNNSDYELSISYFRKAIRISETGKPWYGLGQTYFEMGEPEKAVSSLKKMLSNNRDSLTRSHVHYLLTKSYAELRLCEESRASLEEFKRLTGHEKIFRVMTKELEFHALNCGESTVRQEFLVNSGTREYELAVVTHNPRNGGNASPDSTALVSRVTDINLMLDSKPIAKRIRKKDFEFFLYRDFYAQSYIRSTEVNGVLDSKVYLTSKLNSITSDKQALIWYTLKIKEHNLEELEVKRIQYPGE